ncbi:hypothetical protein CMK13_07565 [Candidatus Poribacteria bacterium]|nr:hypothetical protein [Candidatus Poribacteria bacterium]
MRPAGFQNRAFTSSARPVKAPPMEIGLLAASTFRNAAEVVPDFLWMSSAMERLAQSNINSVENSEVYRYFVISLF